MSAVPASSVLPQLSDILDREESACDRLLSTLYDERTAIRRLAIADFLAINERRLAILSALETLELERQGLTSRLSDSWGFPQASVTLQAIVDRLKASGSSGLDERYVRLAGKLRGIREEIVLNAGLIDAIRGFIEQVLSAWTSSTNSEGLYSLSGQRETAVLGGSLLEQRG